MHKMNEEKQEELAILIDKWIDFKHLFNNKYIRQFIISVKSQNLFQEITSREIYYTIKSYERWYIRELTRN